MRSVKDRGKGKSKGMKSVVLAAIYCGAWLIPTVGIKLLADEVLNSMILHIAFTMMCVPAFAFAVNFVYARRGGQRLWLAFYMLAAAVILYAVFGYNELQPDFIVTNVIPGFFGAGLGGVIRNEPIAARQYEIDNAKKIAEEKAEKDYKPIVK